MGNILFSVGGLVLFHKTLINPCTLSVEDVFPLHVYPFFPFFRVPTRNSRRFGWILPLLLFSGFFRQTYCNSRENRVYYRQRLRKTIVFRVWCREVPVGARHSRGFFPPQKRIHFPSCRWGAGGSCPLSHRWVVPISIGAIWVATRSVFVPYYGGRVCFFSFPEKNFLHYYKE